MKKSKVELGIEFLDREHPGWYKKIDLDVLDIKSGLHCVLGQLRGGHYFDFIEAMFSGVPWPVRQRWARNHGFMLPTGADPQPLTEAWRAAIKRRREAKGG